MRRSALVGLTLAIALSVPLPVNAATGMERPLEPLWVELRTAEEKQEPRAIELATQLVEAAQKAGIESLEVYAVALLRAADKRLSSGDMVGSLALSKAAVKLSPQLSDAHFGLATASFKNNPTGVGEWLRPLQQGVVLRWKDPRQSRLMIGDLGAALLLGLIAGSLAVTFAFAVRAFPVAAHDVRHLLPKGTHRAFAWGLLVLIVLLPFAFRLGTFGVAASAATIAALYLGSIERGVQLAALCVLATIPRLGENLVRATAFSGTVMADVYELEREAPGAPGAARRLEARSADGKAEPTELLALGRYKMRHGAAESAAKVLEMANQAREGDARILVNLAKAMWMKGEEDGAMAVLKSAITADTQNAEAPFNLSKMVVARAAKGSAEGSGEEGDQARMLMASAVSIRASLDASKDTLPTAEDRGRGLLAPALTQMELRTLENQPLRAGAVRIQLARWIHGNYGSVVVLGLPLFALFFFALGKIAWGLRVSKPCYRCRTASCVRCHPSLRRTSLECGECAVLFARVTAEASPEKIRKQIEIAQAKSRFDKLRFAAGVMLAGAGHVIGGLPIRGAIYAYLATFFAAGLLFQGIFRTTYESAPAVLSALPLTLGLIGVSLLSIRELRKLKD